MRGSAPGKIVLSGAYAVLEGAPAIVSAVDRRAVVDRERPADFVGAEIREAVARGLLRVAPHVDVSALREGDRKLGLGSSAAVLVAALATADGVTLTTPDAREALFSQARLVHAAAQGGGSGIDVAASTFGGTLRYELKAGAALHAPLRLPESLHLEVWASETAASTAEFLSRVRHRRAQAPIALNRILTALHTASVQAVEACEQGADVDFIEAVGRQFDGFVELGDEAGIQICTPELRSLRPFARANGGEVLPAGAGGGDVAYYVGPVPPSEALIRALSGARHTRLQLQLNAPGVAQHPPRKPATDP